MRFVHQQAEEQSKAIKQQSITIEKLSISNEVVSGT